MRRFPHHAVLPSLIVRSGQQKVRVIAECGDERLIEVEGQRMIAVSVGRSSLVTPHLVQALIQSSQTSNQSNPSLTLDFSEKDSADNDPPQQSSALNPSKRPGGRYGPRLPVLRRPKS